MSGGMRVRQVCIGSPKTRTFRWGRWAATEEPERPRADHGDVEPIRHGDMVCENSRADNPPRGQTL